MIYIKITGSNKVLERLEPCAGKPACTVLKGADSSNAVGLPNFAFVARQKRLTLDGKHFYCDLVFYHYILKRFILIDLKTHELNHADLGQMQLYINYFDMEEKVKDDNPTIGLILCTKQSKKMVKYFFGDKDQNIFARKYQFYLPTEKELEAELKKEIKKIKYGLEYKKHKKAIKPESNN